MIPDLQIFDLNREGYSVKLCFKLCEFTIINIGWTDQGKIISEGENVASLSGVFITLFNIQLFIGKVSI
jgi:hypothetical protein